MATWGRGRLVLPSVQSVLRQDFPGFELLVIGDACTADTPAALAGQGDDRVRWMNLPDRWGSQSGPNNAGIAAVGGRWIAYPGHDDIWEPFHLSDLARVLGAGAAPDFAVAGTILHNPHGIPGHRVSGIFGDDGGGRGHFFPPSSIAHRRDMTDRVGPWPRPEAVAQPVDMDLLDRAEAGGLRFASTGRVSVHKFTSPQRYLSYLCPSDDEQAAMLADLDSPAHAARVACIVQAARDGGTFMVTLRTAGEGRAPGEIARRTAGNRGISVGPLRPLGAGVTIRQEPMHCGLDWRIEPVNGVRWTARSPRPRMLLPVTGGQAEAGIELFHRDRAALHGLDLRCNGQAVAAEPSTPRWSGPDWAVTVQVPVLRLHPDRPSVLEFLLSGSQAPAEGRRGIGVGDIRLRPVGADNPGLPGTDT